MAVNELNDRPMDGHNGLSRRQIFEKFERDSLRPLPETRYEYGEWKIGVTVPRHYHIPVAGVEYSVPSRFLGSKVNVKSSVNSVEVFCDGKPIAIHQRSIDNTSSRTEVSHLPENHRAMSSYKRENVLIEAERLGVVIASFAKKHIEHHKNVKATGDMCHNISRKMREHGREKVEAAITEAVERGQINAMAVYRIIERGSHNYAASSVPKPAAPTGNIRGSDYYLDREA